jgi:6,7-dimethyl-8-ribityllumazine synthase
MEVVRDDGYDMREISMRSIQGHITAEGSTFALVVSRFNGLVTQQLVNGAVDCLLRHGGREDAITTVYVPGAFELPQAALQVARAGTADAVICLGCVIRGDTPHFDYIASGVARDLGSVALQTGVPLTFGVLTTETLEQALERAGAKAGNKGWDAALSAMEILNVSRQLQKTKKRAGS